MTKEKEIDLIVIGAGPAGMIAAGRAAELGAKVILLEKNRKLGEKLMLTGKGRCNITNDERDLRVLVDSYGKNGKFLFHAFSLFGPKDVVKFFNGLQVKTKTERGQRVFPSSDRGTDVLKALIRYLAKNRVEILTNVQVVKIVRRGEQVKKIITKVNRERREFVAQRYILATGGLSYPETGSTGDGLAWAEKLGHKVEESSPALVPLKTRETWVKDLQGLSLKNVEIKIKGSQKKESSRFGEFLFTHFGVSGPIVLDLSKKIVEQLKDQQEVKIEIDLKPALDFNKLDQRVQRDLNKFGNKALKNSFEDLLPRRMIPVFLRILKIDHQKKSSEVTKEERHKIVHLLKNLELTVIGSIGFKQAIVTSGGVSLKEIDDQTMKSKIINNLYFAGEIINIDGPTGGYNLQLCWSTGYLAGQSATKI